MERLPDDLFIRFLERLRYPLVALEATKTMWKTLETRLCPLDWTRHVQDEFWQAGTRFLGTARTMRDRLRAGGLLVSDREMLDVLALGAVGQYSPPPRWLRDLLLLLDWIAERFRRPRPPTEEPDPLGKPGLSSLRLRTRFHLTGLELETWAGEEPLARSAMGVRGAPAFCLWPKSLPTDLSLPQALQEHQDRWKLSHSRRQALYRLGGTVLTIVLKYITMGPVGLIVSVLHLLAEGLLDVIQGGRRLIWPSSLPTVEEVS